MSYGTKSTSDSTLLTMAKAYTNSSGTFPDGVSVKTLSPISESKSTSGTNRNKGLLRTTTRSDPPTFRTVLFPTGRYTKTRFFDPKYNRWRNRRSKIYRTALVRVHSKRKGRQVVKCGHLLMNDFTAYVSKIDRNDTLSMSFIAKSKDTYGYLRQYHLSGKLASARTSHLHYPSTLISNFEPDQYQPSSLLVDNATLLNNLESAVTTAMWKKAKDQDVNLQNLLAEMHKTKDSLAQLFFRLLKVIIAAKSGNFSKAAGILIPQNSKELSNDVLLWQYGIKPLLSDIDGCFKQLSKNHKMNFTLHTTRSERLPQTVINTSRDSFGAMNTLIITTDVIVKATAEVEVTSEGLKAASNFGIGNILSTAWEVIPWSFIIDWILPIGNWLNNFDALSGITIKQYAVTKVVKQTVWCKLDFKADGMTYSGISYSNPHGDAVWSKQNVAISRVVKPFGSLPSFPDFKNPVSSEHLLNFTALVGQFIKSR